MKRKRPESNQLTLSIDQSHGPQRVQQQVESSKDVPLQEGVLLNEQQKEYMLPHFTSIVIGKPGSGKTSMIVEMVKSKAFYYKKFKYIIVISPSASKMGIPTDKNTIFKQDFSMTWLEERLFEINEKQVQNVIRELREQGTIDKFKPVLHANDLASVTDRYKLPVIQSQQKLEDDRSRLFAPSLFTHRNNTGGTFSKSEASKPKKLSDRLQQQQKDKPSLPQYVDEMYKQFLVKLSNEKRNELYTNCLIILDDVVSDIKANENNPMLTQLFFNRRHLILNGMVSVMLVSQKYTMIPARIRSSANWLILFRLNPIDFENVYKDVVMMQSTEWDQVVEFVFGKTGQTKEKNYNNLSIQVERDAYFMNFNRLNFQLGQTQELISQ